MFKVLILQAMHALSDERTEFLIKDRLSFMRFLGLGLADAVPDANTIWTFREALKKADAIDGLFRRFDEALRSEGFLAMSGQIVDATIVATPKQRNTIEEKLHGKTPLPLGTRRCFRLRASYDNIQCVVLPIWGQTLPCRPERASACDCVGIKRLAFDVNEYFGLERRTGL
jgi:IS5 family transposase